MSDDMISRQKAIDTLADMQCKSDEDGYVWIIRSDAWARIDALPPAEIDSALHKAARKLAWIHQQIDLYDDRPDTHEEDYWMDYLTDPEWDDQDIDWYSGKDKK